MSLEERLRNFEYTDLEIKLATISRMYHLCINDVERETMMNKIQLVKAELARRNGGMY